MRYRITIILPFFAAMLAAGPSAFAFMHGAQDEFSELSESVVDSVEQKMATGDPDGSIAILKRWEAQFEHLGARSQSHYRSLAANIYYLEASIYGSKGDSHAAERSLAKAVEEGFSDYDLAEADPHLAPVREGEKYKREVRKMAERGKYMTLLRSSGAYEHGTPAHLPKFSYADPSSAHLASLRSEMKLDSIAGTGDEASKIVRLMNWVHELVAHNGAHPENQHKTALELIHMAHADRRGLDCSALAAILNESYLAMGFASRVIDCMPRDTAEIEHHTITAVYSRSLGKWLWMDPTNAAFVTDESGAMQGIAEVRSKLIAGRDISVSNGANWNHKISFTSEKYLLEYMPKNLYWFHTQTESGYHGGTAGKSLDFVALVPRGYEPYGSKHVKLSNGVVYFTSDAGYFWQKP